VTVLGIVFNSKLCFDPHFLHYQFSCWMSIWLEGPLWSWSHWEISLWCHSGYSGCCRSMVGIP